MQAAARRGGVAARRQPVRLLEARALLEPRDRARSPRAAAARDPDAEELLAAMDRAADGGDGAGWNDGDRLFHRQIAALTGNPVLVALADHVAAVMDQPLWQRLRDESIAVARPHAPSTRPSTA